MGAHVFKLNKVPLFAQKPMYSSQTLRSVPSFIRIERGSDGGPCPQT